MPIRIDLVVILRGAHGGRFFVFSSQVRGEEYGSYYADVRRIIESEAPGGAGRWRCRNERE